MEKELHDILMKMVLKAEMRLTFHNEPDDPNNDTLKEIIATGMEGLNIIKDTK